MDTLCSGSAFFAEITAILAKCGIRETDSSVVTAIRTVVILAFSFLMAYITGQISEIHIIDAKTWLFLILSGLSTRASWLCYYRALQEGKASVVVPIDKMSILVTIVFSRIVFGERLTGKARIGLFLIIIGTLLMVIPSLSL